MTSSPDGYNVENDEITFKINRSAVVDPQIPGLMKTTSSTDMSLYNMHIFARQLQTECCPVRIDRARFGHQHAIAKTWLKCKKSFYSNTKDVFGIFIFSLLISDNISLVALEKKIIVSRICPVLLVQSKAIVLPHHLITVCHVNEIYQFMFIRSINSIIARLENNYFVPCIRT